MEIKETGSGVAISLNQKEVDDLYSIMCLVAKSNTAYDILSGLENYVTDKDDMSRFTIKYCDIAEDFIVEPTFSNGENV